MFRNFCLLFCALFLTAPAFAAPTRVAVWNPENGTKETRFTLNLDHLNQAAQWIQDAGMPTERVTAEQIADSQAFSAQKFDALVMPGDSFPRSDVAALQKFLDDGGVLISLGQNGRVPFLVGIEKKPDGTWTMAPAQPAFAWQSDAIYGYLGLTYDYNPGKHDQGVVNLATPLLKKYLPNAPDLNQKLPSVWLTPSNGGELYPLVRSERLDGADVPPAMFVAKKGNRTAILANQPFFTGAQTDAVWPLAKETVVALAKLAGDLRSGATKLTAADKIELPRDLPPPEPLRSHRATSSIEPEGAKPLLRFGKFDGTSFDLGEVASGNLEISVEKTFPRGLKPGASVKFSLPKLSGPTFLRIRGGFNQTGAGLKIQAGQTVLWNEIFNYLDAGGEGNFSAATLTDVPAEWTRILFLAQGESLTIFNPGSQPVYFDALQVETRPNPTPDMIVGLGAGYGVGYGDKNVIPVELSQKWGAIRAVIRPQDLGPPGDPKRWNKIDTQMQNYIAMGAPIHTLLEGTPKWAPISEARYKASSRPQNIPPDNAKFAEIVAEFIQKYGDHVDAYELWNEADSSKFWKGTYQEYVAFVKAIVPVIRKLDPTAKIQTTGMAGFKESFFDALIQGGVMPDFDWVAYHAYAGKSTAWDISFGQAEGYMMAAGINKPINNNEQGFVWRNSEWFTPSPNFTPVVQGDWLDKAMARLMANGVAKVSVFHAGGDKHEFGLIDENGIARPGYAVVEDYLRLNNGNRLDFSMASADGKPLQGVYAIGAAHPDGKMTIIVNPVEVPQFQKPYPETVPNSDFSDGEGWNGFAGKPKFSDGKVTIAPGNNQKYMGFTAPLSFDLDQLPIVEVVATDATAPWTLALRFSDKDVQLLSKTGAGTFRVDMRALAQIGGRRDGELTFRATGNLMLDSVRILSREDAAKVAPLTELAPAFEPTKTVEKVAAGPMEPLKIVLRVPLAKNGAVKATLNEKTVAAQVQSSNGASWVEIPLEVSGRSVVTLSP